MITLRKLLSTAILPIGKTMYIWGGGWNPEDTGAGDGAKYIGVCPKWKAFADVQTSEYDFHDYLFRTDLGLDCSGYVGWCMNNIYGDALYREYVYPSKIISKKYSEMGLGTYRHKEDVVDYKAGDIMSGEGHVWICVGRCLDGSVLLLHASPPGVQLNGTVTPTGKSDSQAIQLASEYMEMYYPQWYRRFPCVSRGIEYLRQYNQMRWYVDLPEGKMMDPEHYSKLPVERILDDLWGHMLCGSEVSCGKN